MTDNNKYYNKRQKKLTRLHLHQIKQLMQTNVVLVQSKYWCSFKFSKTHLMPKLTPHLAIMAKTKVMQQQQQKLKISYHSSPKITRHSSKTRVESLPLPHTNPAITKTKTQMTHTCSRRHSSRRIRRRGHAFRAPPPSRSNGVSQNSTLDDTFHVWCLR